MQIPPRLKDALRPYVTIGRRLRGNMPGVNELAWASPRTFSQFGEDRFLLRYFEDALRGFYVDVGAFHPFKLSNTYLLHRRGWRGINLEPDPDALRQFERYRPDDINLPIAVSNQAGTATFVRTGTYAGIEDETHMWPAIPGERITVATQMLQQVLADHLPAGASIDMLDVDCEGHDLDVLRSNDWDRYRPRLVLAEAHGSEAREQITDLLGSLGYRPVTQMHLTLVFERA